MSSKVNVIERLEFELAYYDVAVQHISHCTRGIPSQEQMRRGDLLTNLQLPGFN